MFLRYSRLSIRCGCLPLFKFPSSPFDADIPSLDAVIAILPSTPPLPPFSLPAETGTYTPYTPDQSSQQQGFVNGSYPTQGGAYGSKGDVWLTGSDYSSPPSPST